MMDDDPTIPLTILGVVFVIAFGLIIGMIIKDYQWEADAVRQGHAEYNKETGDWQWKKTKHNELVEMPPSR